MRRNSIETVGMCVGDIVGRAQLLAAGLVLALGIGHPGQTLEDSLGLGTSETVTGFTPRFGGGADLYLFQSMFLNADFSYLLGTGDVEGQDLMAIRLGAGFRF